MSLSVEELFALLEEHAGWLHARCAYNARSLPGIEPDDLFQAVCLRFIDSARSGWFDGEPTRSLQGRARTLLGYVLLHEISAIRRYWARNVSMLEPGAWDGLPGGAVGPDVRDVETASVLAHVLEVLEPATTAVCGLSLLSRDLPRLVLLHHIERAKKQRSGGSTMITRGSDETLALLREALPQHIAADTLREWTSELGAIYYGVEPPQYVPEEVRVRGAEAIERSARRAVRDLAAYLRDHEDDGGTSP